MQILEYRGTTIGFPDHFTEDDMAEVVSREESKAKNLAQLFMQEMGQSQAGGAAPRMDQGQNREFSTQEKLDIAATTTMGLPIVGDVAGLAADAHMYATDEESRNWLNYIMTAAGMLPFVPAASQANRALEKLRVSTRVPTSKASTEDPLTENLIINTDAMASAPAAFEKNINAMREYNSLSRGRARKPEAVAANMQGQMKDNLLWLYDMVPPETRELTKQWYVGANKIANDLAQRYDQPIESVAGALAALSPQKDWYMNASLGERVLDIVKTKAGKPATPEMMETASRIYGKPQYATDVAAIKSKHWEELTDNQKAIWVRTYDETYNNRGHRQVSPDGLFLDWARTGKGEPKKTGWGSNQEISKAIQAIENPDRANISRLMGQQHKVRNFYNNIVAPFSEHGDFTADTHQVAASLLKPLSGNSVEVTHNFGGTGSASSAHTGAQGTYGMYADAGRQAAQEVGVLPREMQSITWEAVRSLFPASFKTKPNVARIEGIWDQFQQGKLNLDDARRAVLEEAGGVGDPDWVADRLRLAKNNRGAASSYQDELYETGLPRAGRVDGGTGSADPAIPATPQRGSVDPNIAKALAAVGLTGAAGTAFLRLFLDEEEDRTSSPAASLHSPTKEM